MLFDQLDERNAMMQFNLTFEELAQTDLARFGNSLGWFRLGQYTQNVVSSSELRIE